MAPEYMTTVYLLALFTAPLYIIPERSQQQYQLFLKSVIHFVFDCRGLDRSTAEPYGLTVKCPMREAVRSARSLGVIIVQNIKLSITGIFGT